jgi:hypothetical protein
MRARTLRPQSGFRSAKTSAARTPPRRAANQAVPANSADRTASTENQKDGLIKAKTRWSCLVVASVACLVAIQNSRTA